jgi:hypothetical protein
LYGASALAAKFLDKLFTLIKHSKLS